MTRLATFAGAALLTTSAALAQFELTAPDNAYATQEGNSNFVLPWSVGANGGRVQFVHDSAVFTGQGVTTPIRVLGLRYRADAITNSWSGGTYPSVQIDMSTSPVDHLAITNTFASNHGADRMTAYNAAVTVASGVGGSAPSATYVDITLTTPFVYDPTTGSDLVVDFTVNPGFVGNGGVATGSVDHVGPGGVPAAQASRCWISGNPASPTGNANFSPTLGYSPVCEFVYAPTTGLWANFDATPPTGPTPLQVQFNDRSVTDDPGGVLVWQWDLDGDTVVDSTLQNPTFTYSTCGSYDVTLTVFDGLNGQATVTKQNFIVTDQVEADFTWVVAGNQVTFTDASTPTPTAWAWDLDGDAVVDSTLQNPVWFYPNGCDVNQVTLTASRACGPADSVTYGVPVAPNSLTTQLTTTTGFFGNGGGALFDVQVLNAGGVNICGVTVPPYTDGTVPVGDPIGCEVWVTDDAGGYAAVHGNVDAWRLAATGAGFHLGGNAGSPRFVAMTLNRPIYLASGSYGMAIHMVGTGMSYRAGGTTAANADLSLTLGAAKFAPFNASLTNNRSFSGTLHYDTVQTGGSAGYGFFGAGCAGSLPVCTLVPTALPQLGSTMSVAIDNLPIDVAFVITGLSRTTSVFGPLPFDVTPLGAPGCLGRVSPDANELVLGAGNAATWNFGIPNSAVLLGIQAFNQALVADPGANTLGAVLSDAAAFVVGN